MKKFIDFIKNSPTAYHAVASSKKILLENNFKELSLNEKWNIEKGSKYFVIKADGSIIAFKIGKELKKPSVQIVASHDDSPMLKIKPNGVIVSNEYTMINSEVYGGLIYSTFLDRPLGIAGRVMIKNATGLSTSLVNLPTTVVIPNLCIHMNREVNMGYRFNAQTDLQAILSLTNTSVMDLLKKEFNDSEVLDYDLFLYNKEEPTLAGQDSELICSPRLDNLECLYSSLEAFIESNNDDNINIWATFNHEEIGSNSNHGAASTFLKDVIDDILTDLGLAASRSQILNNTIVVSADNAHAVHPNHLGKSDPTNCVYMNKGIVIKYNAGLSYTTDAISSGLFKAICDEVNVPYQVYTNRSDIRGGSTLGCILLQSVSVISVDIGLAQLAMHSAYETAGTKDLGMMKIALREFYNKHLEVKNNVYNWK